MVKAVIDITEDTNRILNIIKAKYGLKDKSSAIDKLVKEYAELILESSLTPNKAPEPRKGKPSNKVEYVG